MIPLAQHHSRLLGIYLTVLHVGRASFTMGIISRSGKQSHSLQSMINDLLHNTSHIEQEESNPVWANSSEFLALCINSPILFFHPLLLHETFFPIIDLLLGMLDIQPASQVSRLRRSDNILILNLGRNGSGAYSALLVCSVPYAVKY